MTRDWGWTTGILDSFRRRVLSGDPVVTLCTQLSYFVPRPLTARDVSAADPFNCCGGIYILRLNRKYSSLWQMVIWKFYKPNLHVAGHWITFYTYVDNDRHLPTPETAADSEIRATFMAVAIPEVAKLLYHCTLCRPIFKRVVMIMTTRHRHVIAECCWLGGYAVREVPVIDRCCGSSADVNTVIKH